MNQIHPFFNKILDHIVEEDPRDDASAAPAKEPQS